MADQQLNTDNLFTSTGVLWKRLDDAGDGPRQPEAATGLNMKTSPAECRGNEEQQPQNPTTLDALKSVKAADMQTVTTEMGKWEIQKAEVVCSSSRSRFASSRRNLQRSFKRQSKCGKPSSKPSSSSSQEQQKAQQQQAQQ